MDDQLQGAALPRVRWTCAVGRAGVAILLAVGLAGCTSASSTPPTTTVSSAAGEDPSGSPGSTPEPSASGEPAPTAEPDPEPAPEPTRSDDRSELLIQPDDMAKTGRAGAIAAAKYYMGLYEYVYLTGDLEIWEAMALPGCQFCDVVIDSVNEMHEAGGYRVSGPPQWRGKAETEYIDFIDTWEVTLRAKVSGSTTYDADGNIVKKSKSVRNTVTLGVRHDGDRWRTTGILVSSDE